MASRAWSASRFAVGMALRAVAVGGLLLAAVVVAVQAHYYATALVLLGLAVLALADLTRTVTAADRLYADFVEALSAGAADRPPGSARRFPALAYALKAAADRLSRYRQEQARRVQELEALLDTVSAALLVVRGDGEVILANRAARALAGQLAPRLADIPALGATTAARLANLAPGAREIVRLADERRMLASAALFSGPGGESQRLISLQGLSSELSAVETKAWRDLVRILAHEMMNSLTPIVSLSQSLQGLLREPQAQGEGALAAEAASAMDVIARRSAGLMSFVERYRRVAELPEPRPEPIQAAALIGSLRRLTAGLFGKDGVALECRVQPDGLTLHADPDLLEQALINLLKNAAEAVACAASPRVELSCQADDQQVLIEIADNGAGPPQSDPEMIFTPFFTTKADGSGVGLTLARQIAVAHGGELSVRRNEAGGATFILALPLRAQS